MRRLWPKKVLALLASGLGLGRLVIACAAIYGLLAYAVSQGTSEIGLRLALGADRRAIFWTVVRRCLALARTGSFLGLGASVALGRYARALLYEVSETDPVALGSASLPPVAVAGIAGLLPARRAASVDPVVALRPE